MNSELKEFWIVTSRGIAIAMILFGIIVASGIVLDYIFHDDIGWFIGMLVVSYFVIWLGIRLSGEKVSLLFKFKTKSSFESEEL